jgi:hypothetical protein
MMKHMEVGRVLLGARLKRSEQNDPNLSDFTLEWPQVQTSPCGQGVIFTVPVIIRMKDLCSF